MAICSEDLLHIANTEDVTEFIGRQQQNRAAQTVRKDDTSTTKCLMFNDNRRRTPGRFISLLTSAVEKRRGNRGGGTRDADLISSLLRSRALKSSPLMGEHQNTIFKKRVEILSPTPHVEIPLLRDVPSRSQKQHDQNS